MYISCNSEANVSELQKTVYSIVSYNLLQTSLCMEYRINISSRFSRLFEAEFLESLGRNVSCVLVIVSALTMQGIVKHCHKKANAESEKLSS